LGLPPLTTTPIGSFPQTPQLRRARAELRTGRLDEAAYSEQIHGEIERMIRLQEQIGLDVLQDGRADAAEP
jgi:5-methyltetrahydropteroyltriglutamate--homocysteine methyltransferase